MVTTPAQIYEPATVYVVTLARAVALGAIRLRPRSHIEMTGATLTRVVAQEGADVVVSAVRR